MQCPDIPQDEETRLATLHALNILDTEREHRFDRYTRLSQRVFDMPMALISLIDRYRQWFKSKQGVGVDETSREISFCGHAILGDSVFEIRNARRDPRFRNNPLVIEEPHVRFYAGAPLIAPNGQKLGTLCILDRVPRSLSDDEKSMLTDLAEMVVDEMTSFIDADSGLINRNGLRSLGARTLAAAAADQQLDLLLFDISHLVDLRRRAQDSERETVLSNFGRLLRKYLPQSRIMAHTGGGNFAVLRIRDENFDQALAVRELAHAVSRDLPSGGDADDFLSVFVGDIRFDPSRHLSIDELVREADALFFERARHAGGAAAVSKH